MPFKSQKQRKFMFAKHPAIAERWAKETPKGKALPKRKRRTAKKQPGMARLEKMMMDDMPMREPMMNESAMNKGKKMRRGKMRRGKGRMKK